MSLEVKLELDLTSGQGTWDGEKEEKDLIIRIEDIREAELGLLWLSNDILGKWGPNIQRAKVATSEKWGRPKKKNLLVKNSLISENLLGKEL